MNKEYLDYLYLKKHAAEKIVESEDDKRRAPKWKCGKKGCEMEESDNGRYAAAVIHRDLIDKFISLYLSMHK